MTSLAWEGCVNVRDLGGLPTEDGRRTRLGGVVRSDNVRRLTDEGWRALAEHGVQRIVDLRFPEELAEDQPRDVDIDVVHVSVLGAANDPEYVKELDAHLAVNDIADHYAWSYVEFLERNRARFGEAFAAIADADAEGAVVVHCFAGKDRTGIVAALLLRLVGVDHATIGDDYAVTADNLRPRWDAWLEETKDEEQHAKLVKLQHTPAEAMTRVVQEIEHRYGDVATYLRAAGLSDEQVDRLRERLVAA
ncbi:MAG: protein-tyrosine phosphatase [Gaiellaceae bacterium]|nr:protein-tyrosine phosphatase [Gaiellaceae bacterium]